MCYILPTIVELENEFKPIYDETALIVELTKVVREPAEEGCECAIHWAIDALLRGTRE